jgi:protocatechuate 3,4-dioxygenase, beta subunit
MLHILFRSLILIPLLLNFQCSGQSPKIVGGGCEGCEAIFEYGKKTLSPIDTLPGFDSTEPKLKLTGTVFHRDGKTPAQGVILYIYHTDRTGIYPKKGNETGWARRHGYLRGWIKTDQSGWYTFYTFRPGAYPGRTEPEHIL